MQAPIYGGAKQTETIKVEKESNNNFKGIYAHLMTGVSYMIPFVVAGGIMTALSFAFGGINSEGAIAEAFKTIGGTAMGLMWAALGGYVAFSISDRQDLYQAWLPVCWHLLPGLAFRSIARRLYCRLFGFRC